MNIEKIGVLNALNQGYLIVARALWVILIPVALDLYFWLGPRLSIEPLFVRLIELMAPSAALAPAFQQNFDAQRRVLSEVGAQFNLFSLLATDFATGRILPVPTLKAFERLDPTTAQAQPVQAVITLNDVVIVALVAITLLVIGLLIGVAYMTLIADCVRADGTTLSPLPKRIVVYWLRVVGFIGVIWFSALIVGFPFSLMFGLAMFIHATLGTLVLLVGWTIIFWIIFFLWFVSYAIIIGNVGVARAVWHSINVVQRNLLPTLGLIVLSYMLVAGMNLLWQQFEAFTWGNVVGIVGNAFIGSGLVAGSFVFFQNRYQLWQANK
jgi:hypothetical protein